MVEGNGLLPIPLHGEGSSTDQDEGSNKTPGYLGILPDLLPYNNLSKSRDTCTPRLLDCIKEAWVDPYGTHLIATSYETLIPHRTQDIGYYAHCDPNLSKPLHLRVTIEILVLISPS
jgi:hypothetical protein